MPKALIGTCFRCSAPIIYRSFENSFCPKCKRAQWKANTRIFKEMSHETVELLSKFRKERKKFEKKTQTWIAKKR